MLKIPLAKIKGKQSIYRTQQLKSFKRVLSWIKIP